MSIKIEVKSIEVKVVSGKKEEIRGKIFRIPEIHAYAAITGERHPQPILLSIPAPKEKDDKAGHYQPGVYRLGAASFYVANHELRMRDHVILLPVESPPSQVVLRITVHGTKSANRRDGTLVTVLDCDAHIPGESYPLSCFIEPSRDGITPGEYFLGQESFVIESRRLKLLSKPQLSAFQQQQKAA